MTARAWPTDARLVQAVADLAAARIPATTHDLIGYLDLYDLGAARQVSYPWKALPKLGAHLARLRSRGLLASIRTAFRKFGEASVTWSLAQETTP